MGTNRSRRVQIVKTGYRKKKKTIFFPGHSKALQEVVDSRVVRGYRKGWRRRDNGIEVSLVYTMHGNAVRQEIKIRGKPSRPLTVTVHQRWGMVGGGGTYRRQTTAGRLTAEEARQKELGGRRRVWVK
jgi:ribosomal protein S8